MKIILLIILIILLCLYFFIITRPKAERLEPVSKVAGGIFTTQLDFGEYTTDVRELTGTINETIILLHNTPFNTQVWYPLFMYMQKLYKKTGQIPTLIAYDLLGHSTAWVSVDKKYTTNDINIFKWTINDFRNQLKTVYDTHVRSGKVTLVGYGFGGSVAADFAMNYPDLINKLFFLQYGLKDDPTLEYSKDVEYLANWINANPNIYYLTNEQSFITNHICMWFELQGEPMCPPEFNANDIRNEKESLEFLFAGKMFREASTTTYMQIFKLMNSLDLRQDFGKSKFNFTTTVVGSTRDPYIPPEMLKKNYNEYIKPTNSNNKLYIVTGKHGFILFNSEFISNLLMGQDMSTHPMTVESI